MTGYQKHTRGNRNHAINGRQKRPTLRMCVHVCVRGLALHPYRLPASPKPGEGYKSVELRAVGASG